MKARVPKFAVKHCNFNETHDYKMYQFERLGFFVVDEESTTEHPIFNRTVALREGKDLKDEKGVKREKIVKKEKKDKVKVRPDEKK